MFWLSAVSATVAAMFTFLSLEKEGCYHSSPLEQALDHSSQTEGLQPRITRKKKETKRNTQKK